MSLLDTASLIVTPNGYKEGKLYSVIPSDGSGDLSVTRATTATRVNSQGLVELVPYNLLQYSQDFSNAYWFGETGNTITSNTTTAPDGTLTADTFTATAGNEINVHNLNGFSLADGTFTYSIYLKNNGTNLIEAYLFKVGVGFAARGEINFSAGTFTASIGTGSIENVGNGWFRVSLTNTYTSGTFTTGTYTTSTTGTRSVFAWGAQLVEGSVAKDYQKTETRLNIPRLDYSNGTCPSILVEPQRTNSCLYSEDFSNASWFKINTTVNANAIVSPNGILNADKIIPANGNNIAVVYQSIIPAGTSTASVYAKAGEFGGIVIATGTTGAFFNLTTGQYRTAYNAAPTAYSITSVGNGWYHCSVTLTSAADNLYIGANNNVSNDLTITGNGTNGIYAWGAQLEVGSYATSYIPTTSASVTRNADVISKTGISSLIGQTEGAVMIDINIDSSFAQNDMRFIDVSNGSAANWYFIGTNLSNEIRFYFRTSNTAYVSFITTLTNGRHKLAFAYANNDYVAYVDGVQVYSTSTLVVGSTSQVVLANDYGGFTPIKQITNAVALWKTRLSNTQLAQLTTI